MAESTLKTGAQTYSSAIETADNYARWVLSTFVPNYGQRLLEVGLGHGGYRRLLPPTIDYIGLDIDPDSVNQARAHYPTDTYLQADITDPGLTALLAPREIDTVLCINVLEHIEQDAAAVQNLLSALVPGGSLLILVPAFQSLYSDLDQMAGHVRRYTLRDVSRINGAGGIVVKARYFNAIGGIGWWLNKALRHTSLNSGAINQQILFFDRFVVPIARVVDRVSRSFFGQSMICVIRKV
ncbi:bifunctional 2-polyprenyl-6-hydroxyphenol methylase/3-demethylubiquinol 3-O-methyltransferase UbiG [uncultured Lamprocystis sp.]|jgi:SAM-dependent methyltransferase|uniref:class I SAM-dependent methyltransferase n=1 Tax=uncultured Lamprocystis sp. TaxID=543132 RepID=UPI0025E72BD1|nr:class I SAM-dependent methyltransferase [uncultured Lamprocystis sp.]